MSAAPALATPGSRRRQRRRDQVRARIVEVAIERFSRDGIAATTVESITEAADIAKGTFFNYFPSKEAVAAEIARRRMTDVWIVAQRAAQADSVRPILAALPEAFLESCGRSRVLFRSLLGAMLLNESLSGAFVEIEITICADIAGIFARGQELGEVRADPSPHELARALQQLLWGTLVSWDDDREILPRLAAAVEIFWNGAACGDSTAETTWAV
jgi:AcrR family transcriptional regulator